MSGFPFSTKYVASSAALPPPTFFTAWTQAVATSSAPNAPRHKRRSCFAGATILPATATGAPVCADSAHVPERRACRIAANDPAGAEAHTGLELPPRTDELRQSRLARSGRQRDFPRSSVAARDKRRTRLLLVQAKRAPTPLPVRRVARFRTRRSGSKRRTECRRASRPPVVTRAAPSFVAGSSPRCAGSARRRCA